MTIIKIPQTNNILSGISQQFILNKFYKEKIFNKEYYPYQLDTWYDKKKYGLVDNKKRSLIPKSELIASYQNDSGISNSNIGFVTDAFLDMKKYNEDFFRGNKLDKNGSIYLTLNPVSTHVDIDDEYINFINSLYDIFANKFLTEKGKKELKDINLFMKYFIEFIKISYTSVPLTRSEFIKSFICPSAVSGLEINFDEVNILNDIRLKTETYVNDNNFNHFVETARRYGFFVDKNAPWKIIADLESPVMKKYYKNFNVNSAEEVLANFYYVAYHSDLETLATVLVSMWNSFVSTEPLSIKNEKINGCKNLFTEVGNKKQIDLPTFNKLFNINWLIRLYLFIRCLENSLKINQTKFENIYLEAIKINKHISTIQTTEYINETINELKTNSSIATSDLTKADEVSRLLVEQSKKTPYVGFNF
jgi:hypothetical protein